jgi:pyruvate decarboxylase
MSPTVKLAEYLFTRLQQLGIGAIHGVPGDYNLALLDYVEPTGLQWVGNTNELNAGYAADGYARIKGIGALITTYGVGELSAINAIACAYTEHAAVVHIVGTPERGSQDSRRMLHHTLGDGEYRHFGQMQAHVTVAQTNLKDPRTSPEQIDEVLRQCLLQSRPVYVEVPVDMVAAPVASDRLRTDICLPEAVPNPAQDVMWAKVLDRMYTAKQPLILVDGESRALGIVDDVQSLVKLTKWPTWTTIFGKSLVDESLPNFHGIYRGSYDQPEVKNFVDQSDLVLCFGPHFTTTNSYNLSGVPKTDITISFTETGINMGSQLFRDMPAKYAVSQLLQRLDVSKVKSYSEDLSLPGDYLLSFADVTSDQLIRHDKLWRILANFVRPGDIVLGETGTAGYGVREMLLPSHTRLFAPVTWLSIGYMLPASQGAALAQRELVASSKYYDIKDARTILLIGDGSFQMTAQELATIIRLDLDVVVFLINNDGYTIERCIHGIHQGYNDVSPWRYLQAPSFFGAKEGTYTSSAKSWGELEKVLGNEELNKGKGLRMVEIFMDREDAPAGPLLDMLNKQKVPNR